jgi:two-component system, OmpR family, response regulator
MTSNQPTRKLKILLVDDDPDTRQLVSMIIEKAGHKIQTTGHGKAALTLLQHEKVDMILLDIMMPEIDGMSVLESVRQVSTAPVLMLTALSDAHIMEQCYMLGADDYIVKPFAMNKLLERLDRLALQLPSSSDIQDMPWASTYKLDVDRNALTHAGLSIDLTPNETHLLNKLMENAYIEVSIGDLYEAGWGLEQLPVRTMHALVENTIRGLQSKLEQDPDNPRILLATNTGYSFNPE